MDLLILILLVVVLGVQFCILSFMKKLIEVLAKPMKDLQSVSSLFGEFTNKPKENL
jgi:hypothetical protein